MKAEPRLTVILSKALRCLECQLAFFEQSKRCQSTRRSLAAVDLEGLFRPLSRRSVHALPQTHLDFIFKSWMPSRDWEGDGVSGSHHLNRDTRSTLFPNRSRSLSNISRTHSIFHSIYF